MKMALEAVDELEADTLTAYYKLKEVRPILASAISEAEAGDKPVAWRLRIGDSDLWSYTTTEADADFYGKQSGLRYVKEPLYPTSPTHTAAVQAALERAATVCDVEHRRDDLTGDYRYGAGICALNIRAIKPEDVPPPRDKES
jgi:hypothetical protein